MVEEVFANGYARNGLVVSQCVLIFLFEPKIRAGERSPLLCVVWVFKRGKGRRGLAEI